jgi:transcriptional/translational regulatory protein YebC/TACO1
MINPKIFKAVLMAATKETKDAVLQALVEHIGRNYDYNDQKVGHIVDMLVDKNATITPEKVNLKWVENHLERLMYQIEKYNIRNIAVDSIDNIDCIVRIKFEYLEKVNEDRGDVSYTSSYSDISFNDYPEILK